MEQSTRAISAIAPLPHHSISHLRALAWKLLFPPVMNNAGHLPISETARRVGKAKGKRGRPRKNAVRGNGERELPAVGTLTRTKSLLLAALRVWELKHRISD
jgi:hypothetical protein